MRRRLSLDRGVRAMGPGVILVGATLLATMASGISASDETPCGQRGDVELMFSSRGKTHRLSIGFRVHGFAVAQLWDASFQALFEYYDRDHDGELQPEEARRLPNASVWKQMLWGQFAPMVGDGPAWSQLDQNGDDKVTLEELRQCYARHGVGEVSVFVEHCPATQTISDRLIELLDRNRDGVLAEAEIANAETTLGVLDRNANGLVEADELLYGCEVPASLGWRRLGSQAGSETDDSLSPQPPVQRIELREQINSSHKINATDSSGSYWDCDFSSPEYRSDLPLGPTLDRIEIANLQLRGAQWSGVTAAAGEQAASLARERFTALDSNQDHIVDGDEAAVPHAFDMASLLAVADQDGDQQLSQLELERWLALQAALSRPLIQVLLQEHGASLFHFLDYNGDGALSVRELREGWGRLRDAGCVTTDRLDGEQLPQLWTVQMSPGRPTGGPIIDRRLPDWFRAMDGNGDGDLSVYEFTGPLEIFQSLDRDRDGLLSLSEANSLPDDN